MMEQIQKDGYYIGDNRQLFFDGYLIQDTCNAVRKLHSPTRTDTAIWPENIWENGHVGSATISKDGDRYIMWHTCDNEIAFTDPTIPWFRNTAYAESNDGIVWEKPSLGLRDYMGSTDNNLVGIGPSWSGSTGLLSAFLDTNPSVNPQERFKAVVLDRKDRVNKKGLVIHALWSPDGKNWKTYQDAPTIDDHR